MDEQRRWFQDDLGRVRLDTVSLDGDVEVLPVVVGSREWAVLMRMRGKDVMPEGYAGPAPWHLDDVVMSHAERWVLCPPPWVPTRGERVRGWRDSEWWETSYWEPESSGGHWLGTAKARLWVERVERLEAAP